MLNSYTKRERHSLCDDSIRKSIWTKNHKKYGVQQLLLIATVSVAVAAAACNQNGGDWNWKIDVVLLKSSDEIKMKKKWKGQRVA